MAAMNLSEIRERFVLSFDQNREARGEEFDDLIIGLIEDSSIGELSEGTAQFLDETMARREP